MRTRWFAVVLTLQALVGCSWPLVDASMPGTSWLLSACDLIEPVVVDIDSTFQDLPTRPDEVEPYLAQMTSIDVQRLHRRTLREIVRLVGQLVDLGPPSTPYGQSVYPRFLNDYLSAIVTLSAPLEIDAPRRLRTLASVIAAVDKILDSASVTTCTSLALLGESPE